MTIRNHWIFKLPYFKHFTAMTWAPNIYLNTTITDTMVPLQMETMLAHEEVHIEQQCEEGNVWFLIQYIWKWCRNVFIYGFTMKAYFAIDWEREAYVLTTPGYLAYMGYEDLESNPFD